LQRGNKNILTRFFFLLKNLSRKHMGRS
jgi:hypothetical protein